MLNMFEVRVILLCLPSILLATTLEPGEYFSLTLTSEFFFLNLLLFQKRYKMIGD